MLLISNSCTERQVQPRVQRRLSLAGDVGIARLTRSYYSRTLFSHHADWAHGGETWKSLMSDDAGGTAPSMPASLPPRRHPLIVAGAAFIAGLAIAGIVGALGEDEPAYRTPPECIEALDIASRGFTLTGELLSLYSGAFNSLAVGDSAAALASRARISTVQDQLDTASDPLPRLNAACRAQADV